MIVKEPILRGIENALYTVKIAESDEEVDAALRLRYKVFVQELGRDFDTEEERDHDIYDDQCHHMIVVEKSTNNVIGTYRLQSQELAQKGRGFYTYKRFELDQLPKNVHQKGVEVGRACVEGKHRNGRVLYLLWKGMAGYLEYYDKRYLFGYAALSTNNPVVALNTYTHLKNNDYLFPDLHVDVKETYTCVGESSNGESSDEIDIPPLLKNYLEVGTRVCSLPAHDKKLNIMHFLILLDVEAISDRVRKMFFG